MAANDGFGYILERDDGAAGFDQIAQFRDTGGPDLQRDTIDVTSKSSTNKIREFIGGLRNSGEVTGNILFDYDEATHAQLITDYASDAAVGYRISHGDTGATVSTFSALLTRLALNGAMEGEISGDISMQISGAVTFA
jgi:predicted secreted protein